MAKKKVNRPKYEYDQQAARERNAKVPYESHGILRYDPTTGSLAYPNLEYSNVNPEMRYFNPYLQQSQTTPTQQNQLVFDPTYGTVVPSNPWDAAEATGPGAQQPLYNPNFNPYKQQAFQWAQDVNGNWNLSGVAPGVPETAAQGVPADWSSSYSPQYYQNQYRNPLTAIWGGSNKRTMGTRGWRRPKSSYLPEQQVYTDPYGNVWAERPEIDKRSRWQKYIDEINSKKGNNQNATIAGAPVTWRT